ncbi:MAG: phospho-N-acetylmuramoyl-pentapeptide-transferase, partial [Clostridiales bacterium]|nr:phospho-N-acetylmuramoyl-pentapeptide-transferase [Clostridiales bacterium]
MKELFGYPQVIAFAAVFILSLAAGPLVIPLLKKLNFGQTVREDGPETHLKKQGTPIMGGFIFLIPLTIAAVYFGTVLPQIIPMLLVTLAAAAVGFIDDFIKAVRKNKDGLNPRQKTIGIILISLVFSCYSAFSPAIGTGMIIPFMGLDSNVAIPVWLYIPFITVVMYLIINSV